MSLLSNLRTWPARHRAVVVVRKAAARTHSPSDRIAYALDARMVAHPEVHLATDADYGTEWAAWLAARIEMNERQGGVS